MSNLYFPGSMLKEMNVENTFFPSNSNKIGIAALSDKSTTIYILRLYQLCQRRGVFQPSQELVSFSFPSKKALDDFLMNLPNMTGLEMLLLVNSITPD